MKFALIGQKGIPSTSGGVEKHVEELSTRLVKAGHEVIVYTRPNYTDKKLKEYKGVKLVSLPSIPTKHLDAISHTFLACLDVSFRRKVDAVHFHSIGPSSLIWLIKLLKPGTPVITTFHSQCYKHQKWGSFARWCLKLGEKICCKFPDEVITVSKTLKKYTRKNYNCRANYIPNGVEIPKMSKAEKIKKWGLKKDNYILTVSRLIKHKGIHYLIDAYNQIKTDKKLVIVGDGSYTDDYIKDLKKLAGKNPNIIFTGKQSGQNLNELFSNAYCFVQPSLSEGLSIALLEAMSYRLPVLVSDIPENKEVIGKAGNTFKNGDVKNLRQELNKLLKIKKPESLGQKARERVAKEYNWDEITRKVALVAQEI